MQRKLSINGAFYGTLFLLKYSGFSLAAGNAATALAHAQYND